jgi:hypothetical protein
MALLAATACALHGRLKPRPISGERFGGIAGAAADQLPQSGLFGSQGGELGMQLLDYRLLSHD